MIKINFVVENNKELTPQFMENLRVSSGGVFASDGECQILNGEEEGHFAMLIGMGETNHNTTMTMTLSGIQVDDGTSDDNTESEAAAEPNLDTSGDGEDKNPDCDGNCENCTCNSGAEEVEPVEHVEAEMMYVLDSVPTSDAIDVEAKEVDEADR